MIERRTTLGSLVVLLARSRPGFSIDETADWLRAQLSLDPATASSRLHAVLSQIAESGDQGVADPFDALKSVEHLTDETILDMLRRFSALPRTKRMHLGRTPNHTGPSVEEENLAERRGLPSEVFARLSNNFVSLEETGRSPTNLRSERNSDNTPVMAANEQDTHSPESGEDGVNPLHQEHARTPGRPLSERLAHVVFGPMVADRLLQVEKARAELTDLTTERQMEIASSLEGFQDELNRFCDSFGRTFHDTEDATAVEQARAFSKDLNARLRTLGYRFIDPDTGRAATLTAFPLKKGPSDVYFALCYSSKLGTEKRQTSSVSTIPPLFLTPIQ